MQENLDKLTHKLELLRDGINKGPVKQDAVGSISWATDQLIMEMMEITAALFDQIHENAATRIELDKVKGDVEKLTRALRDLTRQ